MKEFIKIFIGTMIVWALFAGIMSLGSVYEDHIRCERGAVEFCQRGK